MSLSPITIERFKAYYERNPSWGTLHVVLEDGNLEDSHIAFCRNAAIQEGDHDGKELCDILLKMNCIQRNELHRLPMGNRHWVDEPMVQDLKKLRYQLDRSIEVAESASCIYTPAQKPERINNGYEIGDFVITPRVPKTDFQG